MSRHRRGFTLIEVMITVAILGILAALATVAVIYGTGRARLSNAAFEIAALGSLAQMRAQSHGTPHYLVFYESGDDRGVFVLSRDERTGAGGLGTMDWTALDPTDDDTFDGRLVDRIRLTSTGFERGQSVHFSPLSNFAATPPRPFKAISLTASGSTGLLSACTFCIAGGGGSSLGAIRFNPDGTAEIATPTAANTGVGGGAIGLEAQQRDEARRPKLIAFSAPTGSVKVLSAD